MALALAAIGALALTPAAGVGGNDEIRSAARRRRDLRTAGRRSTRRAAGAVILAKTETAPFQPVPAKPAMGEMPVLYRQPRERSRSRRERATPKAQAVVRPGRASGFRIQPREAQRAFREAQKLDPNCALCFWGEALVLGPNINVPMMPEANAPALAALAKAVELAPRRASARSRADRRAREALLVRSQGRTCRARCRVRERDGRRSPAQFPADDTVQVLYAEALMDTQPWDYWEAGGTKAKGKRRGDRRARSRRVLQAQPASSGRDPSLHSRGRGVDACPRRRCPYANRLGALGARRAGTSCTCPRTSITASACTASRSPPTSARSRSTSAISDRRRPIRSTRSAYYPHNIHFVMVSAQMGGDGKTAIDAAGKLDARDPGRGR